jgi:hypothetical protein
MIASTLKAPADPLAALGDQTTGLGLLLDGTAAGAAIRQRQTGQQMAQNGVRMHELQDIVRMGAAADNSQAWPQREQEDWLTDMQREIGFPAGTILSAQLAVLNGTNRNSSVPILAGVQTKHFTAPGTAAMAVAGYTYANNPEGQDGWVFYGEFRRAEGVYCEGYGAELNTSTLSPAIAPNPYRYGDVGPLVLAAGGEYPKAGQLPVSFMAQLSGNGAQAYAGFVVREDALYDLAGGHGVGVREVMALPRGGMLRQWVSEAEPGPYIYWGATAGAGSASLMLGDGNAKITDTATGADQLRMHVVPGATNYPTTSPARAGEPVRIGASGRDPSIDIMIAPQGDGRLALSYAAQPAGAGFAPDCAIPIRAAGRTVYIPAASKPWWTA